MSPGEYSLYVAAGAVRLAEPAAPFIRRLVEAARGADVIGFTSIHLGLCRIYVHLYIRKLLMEAQINPD